MMIDNNGEDSSLIGRSVYSDFDARWKEEDRKLKRRTIVGLCLVAFGYAWLFSQAFTDRTVTLQEQIAQYVHTRFISEGKANIP